MPRIVMDYGLDDNTIAKIIKEAESFIKNGDKKKFKKLVEETYVQTHYGPDGSSSKTTEKYFDHPEIYEKTFKALIANSKVTPPKNDPMVKIFLQAMYPDHEYSAINHKELALINGISEEDYEQYFEPISHQLGELKDKSHDLHTRHHTVASRAASLLHDEVDKSFREFLSNPNKKAIESFIGPSVDKLSAKNNPELVRSRGVDEIIKNLTAAILGVGVLYGLVRAIKYAVTGDSKITRTASEQRMNDLKGAISASHKYRDKIHDIKNSDKEDPTSEHESQP